MSKSWEPEELAWAWECYLAGDTLSEIAEGSGRCLSDVEKALRDAPRLTDRQREVVSLYVAGCSYIEIDQARGQTSGRPGSAAASTVTHLRSQGFAIPHRQQGRKA